MHLLDASGKPGCRACALEAMVHTRLRGLRARAPGHARTRAVAHAAPQLGGSALPKYVPRQGRAGGALRCDSLFATHLSAHHLEH